VLFDLLEFYVGLDAAQSTGADERKANEDTLVKLIRVIANLCIHPQIGQ
jgi:hypothetical protein